MEMMLNDDIKISTNKMKDGLCNLDLTNYESLNKTNYTNYNS